MKAKHLLEYGALRFSMLVVTLLPVTVVYAIGRLICATAWLFLPIRLNVVFKNLTTVFPELSDHEKMAVARKTFFSISRAFFLSMMLPRKSIREQVHAAKVTGLDDLKKALSERKGVILTTIHLGGFQPFFAWLNMHNLPATMIYQRQENPYSDKFFIRQREKFGTSLEHIAKDAGMAEYQRILGENRILTILVDQFFYPGTNVQFFGKETMLAKGVAVLHQRTGAPVFYSVCYFANGHFNIDFREIDLSELTSPEINEESINVIMRRVVAEYEPFIREYPQEWFNLFHKIWKLSGYLDKAPRSWRDIF